MKISSSFIQCLGSCVRGGTQNRTAKTCTSNGIRVDQVHCRHLNFSNTIYQSCQVPGCGEISIENDASPTFNTESISPEMIVAIVSAILIILIIIGFYFLWRKKTLDA